MFPKENNNGSQIDKSLEKTRRPFTQSDRTKSVDFVCTFGHLHSYGFDDKWIPAGCEHKVEKYPFVLVL